MKAEYLLRCYNVPTNTQVLWRMINTMIENSSSNLTRQLYETTVEGDVDLPPVQWYHKWVWSK